MGSGWSRRTGHTKQLVWAVPVGHVGRIVEGGREQRSTDEKRRGRRRDGNTRFFEGGPVVNYQNLGHRVSEWARISKISKMARMTSGWIEQEEWPADGMQKNSRV